MKSQITTVAITASILTACALFAILKSSKKPNNCIRNFKSKKKPVSLPSGLINIGNSCYLSSVIQLLSAAEELISGHFTKCGVIGTELSKLINRVNLGDKQSGLRPEDFIRSFTGTTGFSVEQQDAHEFLLILLNLKSQSITQRLLSLSMSMDLDERDNKDHLHVQNPFTGVVMNELVCLPCATKRKPRHISSLKIEPFTCVTLSNTLGLNEAIYQFFCVPERFSDYHNSGCGLGAINQKNPLIFPELLFLHISLLTETFQKTNATTETVEELSGPGYRYKLLGLIVHFGLTGHAGHFVCFRRFGKGKWIECNDSVVKAVRQEEVLRQRAYILLYQKE